jgi:Domain of unknown function (DUF4907)
MKKGALFLCCLWMTSTTPIHYKIINAAGHSFGYDIYSGGKVLIHQTSIPGLPGNQGFPRRKDAEKVAALVTKKLEKHIMPPTVSRQEMEELEITLK